MTARCPEHDSPLVGFPKAEPGELYCRRCHRALRLVNGEVIPGSRRYVDAGVELCGRCHECSTRCVQCGRRVCPGHTKAMMVVNGEPSKICVECYAANHLTPETVVQALGVPRTGT